MRGFAARAGPCSMKPPGIAGLITGMFHVEQLSFAESTPDSR